MADAVCDEPMRVAAPELFRVTLGVWMRSDVRVAFHGDRRHVDVGSPRQMALEHVVLQFALGEADPPSVIVNDDTDMVRVGDGCGTPVDGGVIEATLW